MPYILSLRFRSVRGQRYGFSTLLPVFFQLFVSVQKPRSRHFKGRFLNYFKILKTLSPCQVFENVLNNATFAKHYYLYLYINLFKKMIMKHFFTCSVIVLIAIIFKFTVSSPVYTAPAANQAFNPQFITFNNGAENTRSFADEALPTTAGVDKKLKKSI